MSNSSAAQYEYKFIRFDCAITGGPSAIALEGYQEAGHQHAADGWRLVQIFAPATPYGAPFWELTFERAACRELK
jgi:hypothetical protein